MDCQTEQNKQNNEKNTFSLYLFDSIFFIVFYCLCFIYIFLINP